LLGVEGVWFVWVGVLHRGWGLDSFSGEGKTGVGGFPGEDKYRDSGLDETESRMTAWGGAGAETSFGVWRVSKSGQLLPGGTSIVEGRVEVTECLIGRYCQLVR
jgi:hypothetical protein